MPWLETNVMDQRIEFVAQTLGQNVNFSELCRCGGAGRVLRAPHPLWDHSNTEGGSSFELYSSAERAPRFRICLGQLVHLRDCQSSVSLRLIVG